MQFVEGKAITVVFQQSHSKLDGHFPEETNSRLSPDFVFVML